MTIKSTFASIFKAAAFSLALAVLVPSFVKLSHAFNHHTHEVCDSDTKPLTHFHKTDLDCDFYKFKLSKNQFFAVNESYLDSDLVQREQVSNYYISFKNHKQLSRFLRGPPQLM